MNRRQHLGFGFWLIFKSRRHRLAASQQPQCRVLHLPVLPLLHLHIHLLICFHQYQTHPLPNSQEIEFADGRYDDDAFILLICHNISVSTLATLSLACSSIISFFRPFSSSRLVARH
ncbi:hypothetical protein GALMADRAFT_1035728 [Galerina marginata CBS 339.88]|uniref:Uncharacterized protein n=1 Tax=Galerina marginata (strain CBS 339.88) TaxID=685588 RepID=A0A067SP72_GALM3|nr:hypothetical protein GALMADRAFT_1035728 [Galerina marginata CBS 339.88]